MGIEKNWNTKKIAMQLSDSEKDKIESVVNVFETGKLAGDYGNVTVLDDGRNPKTGEQDFYQITFGRSQTTEQSGLARLLNLYVKNNGQFAEAIASFLPKLNQSIGKGTFLSFSSEFINILKKSGDDPIMRQTQDAFFDQTYFQEAQDWAKRNGFVLPLSMAVIYDSFIQSGKIRDSIRRMFREVPPFFGGNEKAWIRAYVKARKKWLLDSDNLTVRKTVYRMNSFQKALDAENWHLTQPIIANGVKVD